MDEDLKCWICRRNQKELHPNQSISIKDGENFCVPICDVCEDVIFSFVMKINESYVAKEETDEIFEEMISHLKVSR